MPWPRNIQQGCSDSGMGTDLASRMHSPIIRGTITATEFRHWQGNHASICIIARGLSARIIYIDAHAIARLLSRRELLLLLLLILVLLLLERRRGERTTLN